MHLITAKTRSFEFEGVTGEVYNGFKREELKGRNVIKYKLENKKKYDGSKKWFKRDNIHVAFAVLS